MAFVTDTFTGTAGTELSAHTGETGATWVKHGSYAADIVISDANAARIAGSSGSGAQYYASGAPATAEYDVEATITVKSANGSFGISGRMATGADTQYLVTYAPDGGADIWILYKGEAGSFTQLGTWAESVGIGNSRTVKLEIRDAAKKVYIDSGSGYVERISSADNAITAAGKAGIRPSAGAGAAGGNTTNVHLDNFSATDAAGADTDPPTVSATSPAASATGVAVAVSPTVTFSEAMDAATITTSTVRVKVAGTPVAASVSYDAGTFVATINPDADLALNTAHTIVVETGAEDVAGNAIASAFSSGFTTTASAAVTLGYDLFSGTDGDLVSARPSTGGHDWELEAGTLALSNNRAVWGGASAARAILQRTPTSAEYDIYVEVYVASLSGNLSVYARWAAGAGYQIIINPSRARCEFLISGSFIGATADGTVPLTVGQVTTVLFQIRAAAKKIFVKAGTYAAGGSYTEIQSSPDNSVTQVGEAGIGLNDGSGLQFESFLLGEPGFAFAPDTTAPVVTRGAVTTYAGQATARADLAVTANETAQFRARWGTASGNYSGGTTAYGAFGAAFVPVTGLPGGSTIFYVLDGRDASGNVGTSTEGSFAAPANDSAPPTVGAVTVTPSGDGSSLTFAFSTNEGANATVQVGTTSGVYTLSGSDTAYPTSHSIPIAGTQSGVTYFYRIVATDAAGNVTTTAQASYANAGINATTVTRCRISRGTKTLLAEVWFVADDNSTLTGTWRYKLTSDPDQAWVDPGGGWRTLTVPFRRQEGDSWGRMLVSFLANLDDDESYDVEVTLTDADGVTATAVPLYTDEVTAGNATIVNTSGTVKKWTATVTTRAAALPTIGAATHYLSPSGNDTTGDGTSGTPWRTMNKAATGMAGARVVQLAAGAYAPLSVAPAHPITFTAASPAITSGTETRSGRSRVKAVLANAGSRARVEPPYLVAPGSTWTTASPAGPATGATHQVWTLAGLPSHKVASIAYAAAVIDKPVTLPSWKMPTNTYTPPTGTYAGLSFSMTTKAGFAEVLRRNDFYRYGWGKAGVNTEIWARFPADVDPNTLYVWVQFYEDGVGTGISSAGVRYTGIEIRQQGVGIGPGADGTIFDRCILYDAGIYADGDKSVTPHTRGKNLIIDTCYTEQTALYDPDPAKRYYLAPWYWIKSGVTFGGGYDSAAGWATMGNPGNERTMLQENGGVMRAIVRYTTLQSWFNGIGGYSSGFDRYVGYHHEIHDNWFLNISDDCIESENSGLGVLSWDNIADGCTVIVSAAPNEYGPLLARGWEIARQTNQVGFGLTCGSNGDGTGFSAAATGAAPYGIKWGVVHNPLSRPALYIWNWTFIGTEGDPTVGTEFSAQSNNSGGAVAPYFDLLNNVGRGTRYAGSWPADTRDDYNDWTTTDPARGVNTGNSNKTNLALYRAALTNPLGQAANTNVRSGEFHAVPDAEFVDAAAGDFRLVAGSDFLAGGEPTPYWERPGIDFAGAAPDLGAVQEMGTPPADTTPPTVTATTPAAGAAQVPVAANITVAFNEPMDAATITTSTVRVKVAGTPVAGVTTYDAPSRTATFNPDANLAHLTTHVIEVTTGAEDAAGNALASAFTATFTTVDSPDTTAPTIVGVSPLAGATGVPLDTIVGVTVSEPLDAATVTSATVRLLAGGVPVAATLGYTPGGTTITVDPTAALANNTVYTVEVTTGIEDVAGNALASPFAASFATTASADPGVGPPTIGAAVALPVVWVSVEPTTTRLAYGPTAALGALTALDATLTTAHTATIPGVTPGARVYAQTLGVSAEGVSDESAVVALTVPGRRRGGLLRI